MKTISERSEQALATLYLIESSLPFGECNGRYQRSFADAIALLGKPITEYTVAELISLGEQHYQNWMRQELEQHFGLDIPPHYLTHRPSDTSPEIMEYIR